MARNGSGTWTAPAGQPAVTGVAISSTAHNDLVTDVGTEITDSLSRSGKGAMLAPLKAVDGTATAPGVSFDSATGTGLYLSGGGSFRHAILGTLVAKLESTGWYVNLVGSITAAAMTIKGAVADGAAAVGVVLDNSVDLVSAGSKLVSFRRAGVEQAYVANDGKGVFVGLDAGSGPVVAAGGVSASTVVLTGSDPAATTGFADTVTSKNTVKAWARIRMDAAGAATIIDGFNVASASWATNRATVTWQTDFGDANYGATVSWVSATVVKALSVSGLSTGTATVDLYDMAGVASNYGSNDQIVITAIGAN